MKIFNVLFILAVFPPILLINCQFDMNKSDSESDESESDDRIMFLYWLRPLRYIQPIEDQPVADILDNAFVGDEPKTFTHIATSPGPALNEEEPKGQEDVRDVFYGMLPSDIQFDLFKDFEDSESSSELTGPVAKEKENISSSSESSDVKAKNAFFEAEFMRQFMWRFIESSSSESETTSESESTDKFESETKEDSMWRLIRPIKRINESKEKKPIEIKKIPYIKKWEKMAKVGSEKSTVEEEDAFNSKISESSSAKEPEYEIIDENKSGDINSNERVESDYSDSFEGPLFVPLAPFPVQNIPKPIAGGDFYSVEPPTHAIKSEIEKSVHEEESSVEEINEDVSGSIQQREKDSDEHDSMPNIEIDMYVNNDEDDRAISNEEKTIKTPSMSEEHPEFNVDKIEDNEINTENDQEEKRKVNENPDKMPIGTLSFGRFLKKFFDGFPVV